VNLSPLELFEGSFGEAGTVFCDCWPEENLELILDIQEDFLGVDSDVALLSLVLVDDGLALSELALECRCGLGMW